jgi:hypothetical protein
MTLGELLIQFEDSIKHYDTERLHDFFIELTLQQYGKDETTQEYMILSEKIEVVREMLLNRRHREPRRRGW